MFLQEILDKITEVEEKAAEEKRVYVIAEEKREQERMEIIDRFEEEKKYVNIAGEAVVSDTVCDDSALIGETYLETEDKVIVFKKGEKEIKKEFDKNKLFSYSFTEYRTVLNSDVVSNMIREFDSKSRIVLSRVCKSWYMNMRGRKSPSFITPMTLPRYVTTQWLNFFMEYMKMQGIRVQVTPFNMYVVHYVTTYVVEYNDFFSYCATYSNSKLTSGSLLLLAILYMKTREKYSDYKLLGYNELERFYFKQNSMVRARARENIKLGVQKTSGRSFRYLRNCASFDNLDFRPILKEGYMWNGYEAVDLKFEKFNRVDFQKSLFSMIKL